MQLHNLQPAAGAVKKSKRVGRGQGSGKGGTSARGHKGQKSRSGAKNKQGFEGGQMPLQRRLPKRGFKNPFRVEFAPVNLSRIQDLVEKHQVTTIDAEVLVKHGIITKNDRFKVLAKGELKAKVDITAHAVSATAKTAVEAAGGTVTIL